MTIPLRRLIRHPALIEALSGATLAVFLPQLALRGTALQNEHLSLMRGVGAAGTEWCIVFVVLLIGLLALHSGSRRLRLAGALFVGAFLVFYLLSWGLFFGSGTFINLASLRMGGSSFVLLVKHFVEFNPVVFAFTFLLGPVLVALLVWWSARRPLAGARRLSRGWLWAVPLLVAVCSWVAWWSAGFSDKIVTSIKTGAARTMQQYYPLVLRNQAGPTLHFALDTLSPLDERWKLLGPPYPVAFQKRVSSADYQASVPSSARHLNVILLLVESMRRDVLQVLGGKRRVMPHLEDLASRSQVFSRAYAQATHSDYADTTALSGQYPLRHRLHQWHSRSPPYPRALLHDLLDPRGYRTAIISSQNEHWGKMFDFLNTPGLDHYFHAESRSDGYIPQRTGFAGWAEDWKRSGKLDDRITVDEAIRWIGKRQEPFSVYMNLQNSHFPYRFPDSMPFETSEMGASATFSDYPKSETENFLNRYHNALHYMDQQIGRLLDSLRASGRLDETIVLVSGDTGQAFHEHGFVTHGRPAFEELAGVPLFIYVPGAKPAVYDILVSQVDYVPTLLALLGMPPHPAHQGRAVFERVDSESGGLELSEGGEPRIVITGRQLPGYHEIVVVRGRYKFFLMSDGSTLLFDLKSDPNERKNLSEELPRIRDALHQTALSFRKAQLDYYTSSARMERENPPRLQVPEQFP